MNLSDNKYKGLYELTFTEMESGSEKTEFIIEYSKLSFNDGFLFKTVEPDSKKKFREILNSISKPAVKLDFNIKFQKATPDVNNFVFHLINNKSLKLKKWGLHEDDFDFLEIIDRYNTEEKFQTIGIHELSKNKLQNRIYSETRKGSIYDDWTISDGRTEKMIHQFTESVIPGDDNYRAFEFENWGDYIMGFFIGFIIININKGHLTFFAKDDYD